MSAHRWISIDLSAPLRSALFAAGLTQAGAADRLGVSQPSVAEALGRGEVSKIATLRRWAEAFGLEVEVRVRKKSG